VTTPHETESDLDAYARLSAVLGRAGVRRDEVLRAHGLDETRWQDIDDLWQARLSDAVDAATETDEGGVPAFLAEYARAMERAQSDDSQVMGFERFVEATRAARAGGPEFTRVLERLGVVVDDYLRASRHYTQAMTADDSLAERFRTALR
jgi:hypothetical protein